ncbi:hypothetical protein ABNB59_01245 [Paenibacillus larvae]|uniref:Uncharacterized protein n=3 Tax=Paenibacillus larvae TaxID=1464 RepID=V9W1R7_9BACL|nr:hypothetical protein [Paenibacillus larvae]AHD04048.1 hypothetical protein ERIC2_c01711 [Paenibacillus larvae subsp. larvae DSM 25430]AVF24225.1 phage integrase family protein [Paenibacillus larvae subsp. larvae]AVG10654.1 phage integrase family protein [Paenibacillus larvae subsp. larvae DSM 25430]ETK29063.1 hypothetical protein ERIC1_1c25610 [Paenibacillus larvae subsp. larvae DSM 25719]MDR5567551.1 hypothetical protein [Paenibacillus larvae]
MASIEKRGKNAWRLTIETGYDHKGNRKRERKAILNASLSLNLDI